MKTVQKPVVKAFALFTCLLLFINCGDIKKDQEQEHGAAEEKPIVQSPKSMITLDEARTLYKTYDERRVGMIQHYEDSINKRKGIDEKFYVARYVEYDYETIKQYMAFIEQEAQAAKVDISSLRIYFANNPSENEKLTHPRQNSVMLSPTTTVDNNEYLFYIDDSLEEEPKAVMLNWDFDPLPNLSQDEGTSQDKTQRASILPNLNSKGATKAYQEGISLTLNRGNSAPPPPFHEN